jgi:hypothetical protein
MKKIFLRFKKFWRCEAVNSIADNLSFYQPIKTNKNANLLGIFCAAFHPKTTCLLCTFLRAADRWRFGGDLFAASSGSYPQSGSSVADGRVANDAAFGLGHGLGCFAPHPDGFARGAAGT